ncbi:hypothetical protein J3R30DRAFT_3445515 [Lentinula aciculospora]|uniref:Transmembrane protein n=1 Tax=Lentinula aciculospora TaxID=153920 RepID=A0A9W9AMB0_9AGAR|nr:hypothetical protein J3R30DRAFT_3445515 [Lentinula aciculospora]
MSQLTTKPQNSSTDDKLHSSRLPAQRHLTSSSIDTNASGLADSTISFAGSLHLGRFPAPPLSIPGTPAQSEYSPSIAGSGFTYGTGSTAPIIPRWKKSNVPTSATSSSATKHRPLPSVKSNFSAGYSKSPTEVVKSQPSSPKSRTLSPYDWHEGASSIDVDATEDRLLPTNFITSLLQENSTARRTSISSDAYSGFSEMTYPPVMRYPGPSERPPPLPTLLSPRVHLSPKPQGARPPLSTFSPIPEAIGHITDDSDTLASNSEFTTTVIRSASISRGFDVAGASVVGVAPARLQSYSSGLPTDVRNSSTPSDDRTLSYGPFGDILPSYHHSSALPSSSIQAHFLRGHTRNSDSRQSIRSTKSFVPSVISRISETGRSLARNLPWKRKPLPPVPTIPHIPIAAENQSRLEESRVPLPQLVARADVLNGLLEKGYHPHHSVDSYYGALPKEESHTSALEGSDSYVHVGDDETSWTDPPSQREVVKPPNPNRKRYLIALAIFLISAAAAIGAGVGVSLSHRSSSSLPTCSNANTTGMSCDLDATCVCTLSVSSQCNGLAQSIVALTPTMNQLFNTNYSVNSVYTAIWLADGSAVGSNCASQALLIDTPGLSSASTPNRTSWARSAMLWNLVQSQDVTAIQSLQSFTSGAPWSTLSSDGPISGKSSSFSVTASGFTFDFAAQTLTQPAVSFTANGQPVSEQISRVGSVALAALNRMYTYATASSTQRQNALELYWVNVLGQKASDLSIFRSAVVSSTILIPFDATYNATSQALSTQMTNSTTQPFPVPLSCYPGLNSTQIQQINDIEQTVYGLSAVSTATSFDTSCYPDRPLYGVLDVLRLRLPFIDTRTGAAMQAASLQHDVGPRAVIRSGEMLSALPLSSNASAFSAATSNPRDYGTLNNFDHVLLDYVSSILDVNVAIALASFLTSTSNAVPPSNTSILASSIETIPSLEVAIFGSVLPSDIGSVLSSFVSPAGALFFGSTQGQSMRDWAIVGTGTSVVWAESALSTQVVRDNSLADATFEDIWENAALAIDSNAQNVGVGNITGSLQSTGEFSS